MSLRYVNFFISTTFLATIVGIAASQCVQQTPCSCHFADGTFYDLSKLSAEGPMKDHNDDYSWSFQPCKNVNVTLETKNITKNECNNSTGVSLCVQSLKPVLPPFSLGNTSETKWDISVPNEPRLILNHGTNTTEITLSCCASCTQNTFTMGKAPNPSKFNFFMVSPHVCKQHSVPEGLSLGSVLVILLFFFSAVYLLVGALVLRFVRGAIGWELIPNYDFWSGLPALVRDGVAFTFSGCSVDSYDRI